MTRCSVRWLMVWAGLAAVLVLAGCGSGSGTLAGTRPASRPGHVTANTIVIKSFMFHPASLIVAPGATVTVHNEDSVTHTLTDKASPKLFSTGDVAPGQVKTFKAPGKAGSYPYICTIHQFMTGTLVVR